MADEPRVPPTTADEVVARAHRVIDVHRIERGLDWTKLVLIAVLIVMNAITLYALRGAQDQADRSEAILQRVVDGQELDRCEARRIGEYLASFSDFLGVPATDPYRKELDEHLRRVAEQIRSEGDVCAPVPPPPTPTTLR